MNKIWIIIAIVLVVVFAGIYLYSNNKNVSGEIIQDLGPQTGSDGIREFTVTAKQWKFEPSTIEVNQGDLVRLGVTSIDVTHGISIPGYGINERLSPGQTVNIEFVADRKGTFPFSCSVSCGVGAVGCVGAILLPVAESFPVSVKNTKIATTAIKTKVEYLHKSFFFIVISPSSDIFPPFNFIRLFI